MKHLVHEARLSLQEQLMLECEAMAKCVFASGMKVPGPVVQMLASLLAARPLPVQTEAGAVEHGTPIQGTENPQGYLRQLAQVHEQLSGIVAPAKPKTILLMATENKRHPILRLLGPVPLIRGLMVLAVLSLVLLLLISISSQVDGNVNWAEQSGLKLLLNELFIVSAAAIGASFSALFVAHKYISKGTFDPKYDYSYWIRFVLGLISSTILALLIPVQDDTLRVAAKPTLAMLGGFSVTVVYRLLNRMVETVETLIYGDAKETVEVHLQAAKTKAEEENVQSKLKLAAKLVSLKDQLGSDLVDQDLLKKKLNQILQEIVPVESENNIGDAVKQPANVA